MPICTPRSISFPDHSGRVLFSRPHLNSVWCSSSCCSHSWCSVQALWYAGQCYYFTKKCKQAKQNFFFFLNIDFPQHAFNVLGCHCPDFSYLETSSSVGVLCLAQGHSGLCLCASLNGLENILQECEAEVQVHYLQW